MSKTAVVLVLAAVLLPCAAMAQWMEPAYMEDEASIYGLRANVGWFDMGDADTGLGIGADYLFPALGQDWMLGLQWGEGEIRTSSTRTSTVDVWALDWNWIASVPAPDKKYQWYYGGGIGYYRVENSDSEDSIGFQVLAGINFSEAFFGQVKYVIGTDFDDENVDGIRVSLGYKFK